LSPHSQEHAVKPTSDAVNKGSPTTSLSNKALALVGIGSVCPYIYIYRLTFALIRIKSHTQSVRLSLQKEDSDVLLPLPTSQEPHTISPTSPVTGDKQSFYTSYDVPDSQALESPSSTHSTFPVNSQARELSADPLLLFTPSQVRTDLLADVSSTSPNSPLLSGSHVLHTPPFSQPQTSLSPLTPPHPLLPVSDVLRSHVINARSHIPQDNAPMREVPPQAGPSRSATVEPINAAENSPDIDSGRYSLRARNARQKMPYRYEAAAYKQQMRGIPEAIVMQRNPQHSHRSDRSSPTQDIAASSGSEVDPTLFDAEDSDTRRRPHRRSKSSQLPDKTISAVGDERGPQAWLPAFLQVQFSSSEEEPVEQNKVVPQNRDSIKKKRRIRSFPLSAKKIGKLPAVPNEPEVSFGWVSQNKDSPRVGTSDSDEPFRLYDHSCRRF
jgi:hypothetical protein